MKQQRAYSLLEIKAVDEGTRTITGMATTPTPDRYGDIVEPDGAQFKNPMPLLWQHQSDKPVGIAKFGKPTAKGIPFEARIESLDEPGTLKDRLDEAWHSVKLKLVRAVSIGFRALEFSYMDGGGIRFTATEILELSLVTIPANAEATIQSVKSIDTEQRAASGQSLRRVVRLNSSTPPGASGPSSKPNPTPQEGKDMNVQEQIQKLEATRAAKAARLEAIQKAANDRGTTKDGPEKEEFGELRDEIKSIDEELVDLRAMEEINKSTATPVKAERVNTTKEGSELRTTGPGRVVSMERQLPKGTGFTRYVMALIRAKGNLMLAAEMSKQWKDTPEVELVLKAAVAAGTTTDATWASPLVYYQNLVNEFIELLRPMTIIGRIAGFRRVPFNVRMPKQTAGGTYQWVGETAPKPVGKLDFSEFRLGHAKAAGIIVISEELARESSPSAEAIVRQDMIDGMAAFLDEQFINPDVAAVTNVSPASVLNGVTPVTASGSDADALRTDLATLWGTMLTANLNPAGGHFVMTATQAMKIGLMRNSLGQKEFPDLNANGGTLEGFPVVTSQTVPGNSNGDRIAFIIPREIFLAEEGLVIDVSREASVQMNTAPDNPASASTVLTSLWQNNLVGLRAERFINWAKRRTEAAGFIQAANYR